MMLPLHRAVGYPVRILLVLACCLGIWDSIALARADYEFRLDSEQSIKEAIRLVPDGWEYYMRLAQFDRDHAQQLLSTSLQLNQYDAQADIELGLQHEAAGDYQNAEKYLLQAYSVDHTYLPRWSLANYYFRRDNAQLFWTWARSAASMPADDIGALLDLCWRVAPDAQKVSSEILNDKPEMLRQYIPFLLGRTQPDQVVALVPRLIRAGDPRSDRDTLFGIVNRLIAANDGAAANTVWRQLVSNGWTQADNTLPNNGAFAREPLPIGFDWTLPEADGLHSWPGSAGLATEFTGSQPENFLIAEQSVPLAPGDYTFTFDYHTSGVPPGTGIRWQVYDPKSNTALAESSDLSSDAPTRAKLKFSVPTGDSLVRLRLFYHRTLGTTRFTGSLDVTSTQIQAGSQS